MTDRILVPIDISHPDQAAKLIQVARRLGGEQAALTALYVTAEVPSYVAAQLPEDVAKRSRAEAKAALEGIVAGTGAKGVLRTGTTYREIIECANEIRADLIVLGPHRPGFADFFLGSTTGRVLDHAPCAVYVDR